MRQARLLSSAAGLTLLSLLALLLLTPAAAAATADDASPAVTAASSHPGPLALASTGLDITVPVIIGLTTLVVGIALVAWAFLRTGSAEQHH
jgi:hypothetical protein